MVFTESQSRTSNVSNSVNKRSKLKGSTASDKNWQPSTIKECNLLKHKSGIGSEPCHIFCSGLFLSLRSDTWRADFEICTCKKIDKNMKLIIYEGQYQLGFRT